MVRKRVIGSAVADTSSKPKPAAKARVIKTKEPLAQPQSDPAYDQFLQRLQNRFVYNVGPNTPMFTVDAGNLFDVYLKHIPLSDRQHSNCNACRHFVNRYGGLITLDDAGNRTPAFWHEADAHGVYKDAVKAVAAKLMREPIVSVFYTDIKVLGTPETGLWHHLSCTMLKENIHVERLQTTEQKMAESKENFRILYSAIREFSLDLLQQADTMLATDSLYRGEKCKGVAEFLLKLKQKQERCTSNRKYVDLVWKAVSTAPPGYCHPKSSMIGTLLEDLASGMSTSAVQKRFQEKMNPLQYQRPTAAPKEGNIDQAEKLVEKLGIELALPRRVATLNDIVSMWTPKAVRVQEQATGVFASLRNPLPDHVREAAGNGEGTAVTWAKFKAEILERADKMQVFLGPGPLPLFGFTTAVSPDAPPILQWDSDSRRNPVSWYTYFGGSPANVWSLCSGTCVDVVAVSEFPHMWYGRAEFKHHAYGALFVLAGARDRNNGSASLFPEQMRAELHPVRATIEAYSKTHPLATHTCQNASGIAVRQNTDKTDVRVAVTMGNVVKYYVIDRWD